MSIPSLNKSTVKITFISPSTNFFEILFLNSFSLSPVNAAEAIPALLNSSAINSACFILTQNANALTFSMSSTYFIVLCIISCALLLAISLSNTYTFSNADVSYPPLFHFKFDKSTKSDTPKY